LLIVNPAFEDDSSAIVTNIVAKEVEEAAEEAVEEEG
jgi:hypothetical protein